VPSHGDSEQWLRDAVARLEAHQEILAKAVAEIAARIEQRAKAESEAEEILRRAASPDRPRRGTNPRRRGRRSGDTFLHVVRAALVAVLCMGAVLALMAPRHLQEQRYTPRSTVQVADVHNDHDADDR